MKPSRSREVFGPGIAGANVKVGYCDTSAELEVLAADEALPF